MRNLTISLVIVALLVIFQEITNIPPLPKAAATPVVHVGKADDTDTNVVITPEPPRVLSNEEITHNFLISQGFTKEQTAGVMGNLVQEHNFSTSDVPGGLGIAQWIGGRRANLMARPNYTDINVQLQFMMDELNSGEKMAHIRLRAAQTIEDATIAFQNGYERCGKCMQNQRIQYAYAMFNKYK